MLSKKKPFQYEHIARTLEDWIRQHKFPAGSRIPSEPELATHFKVNSRTVRRALLDLEHAGKLIRRQGKGTFVADAGVRSRELLYLGDMEDHYFKERFLVLHTKAQERGFRLFGVAPGVDGGQNWQKSLAPHIDHATAIVVQSDYYGKIAPYLANANSKVTLIIIGDARPEETVERPAYYALTDFSRAMTLGMQHLLAMGHRHIALLAVKEFEPSIVGEHPPLDNPRLMSWIQTYYTAYRAALISYGVCQWEMVLPINTVIPLETNATAKQLKRILASKNRPTAFMCDMDYRARFLYHAANELGLAIPRDISVVGLFDTPWCKAWVPELTSVNLGHDAMAEIVLNFCGNGPAIRDVVCRIEPSLVARQSCAAVPVGRIAPPPTLSSSGHG